MDDKLFEQWSETLAELRKKRLNLLETQMKESSFEIKNFSDVAKKSLDDIMTQWWNFEVDSFEAHPPDDRDEALATIKEEMDSIVEFEEEAIERDMAQVRMTISWPEDLVQEELKKVQAYTSGIKSSFQIKIDSLGTEKAKKVEPEAPEPQAKQKRVVRVRRPGATSNSGVGVFTMFVVGLLLGGGPAIYFWDDAKKQRKASEEELSKVRLEKRAVEDTLTLVQESFSQLAYGKIRNIPQLQKKIVPIRARYKKEKAQLEKSYFRKRENLLKKVPPGDRLDRSLQKLEDEKQESLKDVDTREVIRLRPILEELENLKEMIGQ